MSKKFEIKTAGIPDRVKQTLESTHVPVYDWMLDAGLHQADLLVYAAIFDILRHEPLTPQKIKLSDVAKRLHYTPQAVYGTMNILVDHQFLYRQGSRQDSLFSLYPFDTLDLK